MPFTFDNILYITGQTDSLIIKNLPIESINSLRLTSKPIKEKTDDQFTKLWAAFYNSHLKKVHASEQFTTSENALRNAKRYEIIKTRNLLRLFAVQFKDYKAHRPRPRPDFRKTFGFNPSNVLASSNNRHPFETNNQLALDLRKKLDPNKQADAIDKMPKLGLSACSLTILPAEIQLFGNISTLDLEGNFLSELPKEISQLEKLKELNLINNQFAVFPSVVNELPGLTILWLDSNQITEVSEDTGSTQPLTRLGLCANPLQEKPTLTNTEIQVDWTPPQG